MLYQLFKFLESHVEFPGNGLYKYLTFRAFCVAIVSFLISMIFTKKLIKFFINRQILEQQRDLDIQNTSHKSKIPSMGGLAIISGMILSTLLFADIYNVYIILLIVSTIILGGIGYLDDYIKNFRKNKEGLKPRYKTIGHVLLGCVVSLTLHFNKNVVIREYSRDKLNFTEEKTSFIEKKSMETNVPFLKNNTFDYASIVPSLDNKYTWIIFFLFVLFVISATSNASNILDGLDGLAASSMSIIGLGLAIMTYLSGNYIFAQYLNIFYIPNIGEVTLFCIAYVFACIGFLWYNAYPAQIFMGDTGSLTLGGLVAIIAFIIRKELLIPLMCGVLVAENLSVIIQVAYFKYTRKRYGVGKRIFLCAPLHHHFQKLGIHEAKIVSRMFIASLIFTIVSLVTFKIR